MSIEAWVRRVILRGTNGNEMSINTDGSLPVTIQGANSTGGALGVDVQQSEIIQPTDIQSHLQTTIQTHNAVSIPLSGSSISTSWIDCDGFDKVAITVTNDSGSTNYAVNLNWSNDGANTQGDEAILVTGSGLRRAGVSDIKARYLKVNIYNNDSALAHTMSAWAFLKA